MGSNCFDRARRRAGFTIIEIVMVVALLGLLAGGVTSSFWTVQTAFGEERSDSELTLRSRSAMDRLAQLVGSAVTSDAAFSLLPLGGGGNEWGLRFRELEDVVAAAAVYDDVLVVHLIGPNQSIHPAAGVVIGRAPDLDAVWDTGAGADGLLGTTDDDATTGFVAGVPAVEVLLPAEFAPQVGPMLTIVDTASASGRLITITLRTNFLQRNGTFLRSADFVLEERIALRF